jgi:hypothetical protein
VIRRGELPKERFYVLRNEIADDRRLSWGARGLLIHLLTKPEHWQVSPAALVNQTKEARIKTGRDGVYSLLKELEKAGYVSRQQRRSANGKMAEADYIVSEGKFLPRTAQPHTVNPTQVINENTGRTEALPERTHRPKKVDELPEKKVKPRNPKAGNHPSWNHQLSQLTSEGVSAGRARTCLGTLVGRVGEAEALSTLESARADGDTGSSLIDTFMRSTFTA